MKFCGECGAASHSVVPSSAGLPADDYYSQASLLRAQGQALALKGDAAAEQSLVQSINTLEQHEYPADLALSCRTYAAFLSEHGREGEARRWQAKASTALLEAHIRDSSASPAQMLPVTTSMPGAETSSSH
ncbi:MAG: hypothetical protein DLM69_06025 [Candidatus Chloroheliales bacterium]|nr:MAG: hypothetical protein DLM69_06025 [Chloroflexota bacterium]